MKLLRNRFKEKQDKHFLRTRTGHLPSGCIPNCRTRQDLPPISPPLEGGLLFLPKTGYSKIRI